MDAACLQCEWVEGLVSPRPPGTCILFYCQWRLQTQSHRTITPKAHNQNCTYRPCYCRFGLERLQGPSKSSCRKPYRLFRFHAWLLPRQQLSPFRRVSATPNTKYIDQYRARFKNRRIKFKLKFQVKVVTPISFTICSMSVSIRVR